MELDAVMDLIDDDRSGAVNLAEFEQYWREHVEAHATGTDTANFPPPFSFFATTSHAHSDQPQAANRRV